MFGQLLHRLMHSSCVYRASDVTKSALAVLRKQTGYPFISCRKALEMYENDLKKAEEWLHLEAQKQGWDKVEKLKDRVTTQGLVGIHKTNNSAVLVELNSETDFAARSYSFRNLLAEIISLSHNSVQNRQLTDSDSVAKWDITTELKSLPWKDGKTVADMLALNVGKIGENLNLRRAVHVKVKDSFTISGYVHPAPSEYDENEPMMGKYAAVVIYKKNSDISPSGGLLDQSEFGRQLCQHIIGMNPKSIGNMEEVQDESVVDHSEGAQSSRDDTPDSDEAMSSKDDTPDSDEAMSSKDDTPDSDKAISSPKDDTPDLDEDTSSSDEDTLSSEEEATDDETELIHQQSIINPEKTVGQLLRDASIEVVDFVRYECGETVHVDKQ